MERQGHFIRSVLMGQPNFFKKRTRRKSAWQQRSPASGLFRRGHSLMVKFQPSKLAMRVRFPLPARCLMLIPTGTAVARTSIAGQKAPSDTAFSNEKTIALMELRLYARHA